MTQPLRFGILGCARIARRSLIPAIRATADARLHAIASMRPGVAAEWADEFGALRSYSGYDQLLDDAEIDAVYIPATGEQHAPLAIAAARAGKHVLCEKPLATNAAEAEVMAGAGRDGGVLLQEAFQWRHHPRTGRTRELLEQDAIGPLRIINVSFSFPLPAGDWRTRPERGGGAMWDLGCYGVNAARYFTAAEPCDVYARAHFGPTGVDLSMQLALRFPGDVLANVDCSFEAPWRCRMELVGTHGRIEWHTAFQDWAPEIRLDCSSDWSRSPEVLPCARVSQSACLVGDFVRSIRAGALLSPAENGLANMRVLERAWRSASSAHGAP